MSGLSREFVTGRSFPGAVHEAHFPAEQPAACPQARFPGSDAHAGRTLHLGEPAVQGPHPAVRLVGWALGHAAPGISHHHGGGLSSHHSCWPQGPDVHGSCPWFVAARKHRTAGRRNGEQSCGWLGDPPLRSPSHSARASGCAHRRPRRIDVGGTRATGRPGPPRARSGSSRRSARIRRNLGQSAAIAMKRVQAVGRGALWVWDHTLGWLLRAVFLALIWLYQRTISPLLPPSCRFHPSCSAYGFQAISVHGSAKGLTLAIWRLLRCNPWNRGGLDPVPDPGRWLSRTYPDGRERPSRVEGTVRQ